MACCVVQERVPDAKNMFSEIRRFPRAGYRVSAKEDIPQHMTRAVLEGGGDPPSPVLRRAAEQDSTVTGANRTKFFHQPLGGTMASAPLAA
jgi:hypothetical protein